MITAPLSATDTFNPAMERTKQLLFKPFRFAVWWRIAFLALFTGELSGSKFNFNLPSDFRMPSRNNSSQSFAGSLPFHMPPWHELIPFIILGALVLVALMLVLIYVSSILRFVLFDAVLSGNVRIRQGWQRWRERGQLFFPWQIGYMLIMFAVFGVVFGIPVFMAWRAGLFRNPSQNLGTLILGGLALFVVMLVVVLAGLVVFVLTKDFVVPIMAFEGVGPIDGWRRLKLMISANKGSYAGYLGFKAVLAIAAGIVVSIIGIVIFLIVLVPIVIIAVVVGVAGSTGGAGLSALALTALILGGIAVGLLLLFVMSMISVPVVVFFQSYALHFFGSRYEPLRAVMYPDTPPQIPPGFTPQPAM